MSVEGNKSQLKFGVPWKSKKLWLSVCSANSNSLSTTHPSKKIILHVEQITFFNFLTMHLPKKKKKSLHIALV